MSGVAAESSEQKGGIDFNGHLLRIRAIIHWGLRSFELAHLEQKESRRN